jgi:VWFA-related protein
MRQAVPLIILAAAFATAQDQRPTLRTGAAGVIIDVTVLDQNGRPVTDLTASDFEIREDGKPQQIITATLMRGGIPARINSTTASTNPSQDASRTPAAADTTTPPRTPVPTVTAILFDNLSADTRPFATRAAAQFVNTLAATNEYGGVFLSGLRLTTIQPFTNHTADLRAAVERVANTAPSSVSADTERKNATIRTQGITTETPVTANAEYNVGWTTVQEREQRLYKADPSDSEQYLNRLALRMQEDYSRFLTEYEGEVSLSGLRSAVDGLAPLPGRKSILYFTEEVQITSRLKSRFDALVGEANRANITIYPVDAAGLRVQSKEGETGRGVELAGKQGIGDAHRNDGAWSKDLEKQEQMLSSGGALGRLANETGGFLIDNTNNLAKGVTIMQVDRTTYYMLGYQPTNAAMDGKFRKVSVKVKRGKCTVRARPGYVADVNRPRSGM